MREVAVARADPVPDSPVYQVTVFAGVPATCDVALPNGEPATRSGGTAAGAAAPRPSAANAAAFELVTVRLVPLLLRSAIGKAPASLVEHCSRIVLQSDPGRGKRRQNFLGDDAIARAEVQHRQLGITRERRR